MSERGPYRVGQEVRVTYTARVAEVGEVHSHREGRVIRLESAAIPTGWIDPDQEGLDVEVIGNPLPTEPGMYWSQVKDGDSQGYMGNAHTDGKRFYYRNASLEWVDVGFGAPHPDDCPLNPLIDTPF